MRLPINQRTNQPINLLIALFFALTPVAAFAAPLNFRHLHYIFTIDPAKHPEWRGFKEAWTYQGQPIVPPAEFRVDGDDVPMLPPGFAKTEELDWNRDAIRQTIQKEVAPHIDRPAGTVTIRKDEKGTVVFDGVGLTGQKTDVEKTAELTLAALNQNAPDIYVPVKITQPAITVLDPELTAAGIQEVVTIGESDFSNSPPNRIHNIHTGLDKFNGHLIPRGSVFSFIQTLGPVNGTTGYLKELVIKGDRTVPDYGGGLCQVSSTAYRGVWEYGFPITDRTNHSYVVSHYYPVGTDATVFTPNPDMKFLNDSPGALLMQTYTEGTNAYFIYYGTKDARQTTLVGPFMWDRTSPPADRIEETTDLPPGETKKLQQRVPGMKAMWYRITKGEDGTEKTESVYSAYQAKPYFYQLGVLALTPINAEGTGDIPSGDVEVPSSSNAPSSSAKPPVSVKPKAPPERPHNGR